MVDRRVVVGRMPDNSIRLRTSLQGYDALTAPDSPDYISYDSNWNDFVKLHAIGQGTIAEVIARTSFYFADLGYKPFVEVRQRSGTTVFDDYIYIDLDSRTQKCASGYDVETQTNRIDVMPYYYTSGVPITAYFFGLNIFYVVYRLRIPE